MPFIALLLLVKIAVTAIAIVIPFLFLPQARLARMTGIENGGAFFRLYGVAILALLIGYAGGFAIVAGGQFPWSIAVMGIVSNGGAAAVLFLTGQWRRAKAIGFFVAAIALAWVLACANSAWAMTPLW